LGYLLKQQSWVNTETVQVIEKASVPVIKFLTTKNVPVDITVADKSPYNINNGINSKNMVQQQFKENCKQLNLGSMLLGFLQLYGKLFEVEKVVIHVRGGYPCHSAHLLVPERFTSSLRIVDPFNPRLIHSAFMISKVQIALAMFYENPQHVIHTLRQAMLLEEEDRTTVGTF